jgi:mycothiol system anti-sigma-R factor
MECRQVIERLWEYLDGELVAEEAAAIRRHFDDCSSCPSHCRCDRAFLLLVIRTLAAPCPAPAGLSDAIRARLAAIGGHR